MFLAIVVDVAVVLVIVVAVAVAIVFAALCFLFAADAIIALVVMSSCHSPSVAVLKAEKSTSVVQKRLGITIKNDCDPQLLYEQTDVVETNEK